MPDSPPESHDISEPLTQDVERRTWEEFRSTGLLWAANTVLQWWGWAIIVVTDDADSGKVTDVYPARTRWRGFLPDANERGITRLTEWMASAANSLRKDISE